MPSSRPFTPSLADVKFCGATILSDRYVLTAAHCTSGANMVRVYPGAHNLDEVSEFRESAEIIVHPGKPGS